jgi:lipoate-protein ligase A
MAAPGGAVTVATPQEEQDWNTGQLAAPITRPAYRVWLYRESALVMGRPQFESTAFRSRTLPVVFRSSGGGAVPVGPWMVGMSVALPNDHPFVSPGIADTYRWIGEMHAQVLRRLGARVSVVHPASVPPSDQRSSAWSCFGALSPWEVVGSGRRKLVGLAQARRKNGVLLVAGTLVTKPDWYLFARWMGRDAAAAQALIARATDCEREIGHAVPSVVAADLAEALRGRLEWRSRA